MNPSKGERPPFTLRVPIALLRRLEVYCAKAGVGKNEAICKMIEDALDRVKHP